uniref:G-protein coupled receptors family 1 profile domain-containing protein n=1 Tax=Mola mola TaxID=94237 RepID=A0A3Q3X1B3_MOLML
DCLCLYVSPAMNWRLVQGTPLQVLLSMVPCLLFLYVNSVLLYALLRKPLLLESPCYILFGHLLFIDSLHLVLTMLLYLFAVIKVTMISYFCVIIMLVSATAVEMSPHADSVTTRRTRVAIAFIWTVGSLDSFTQFFMFVSLQNTSFTVPKFCSRNGVFQQQIYSFIKNGFIIVNFILVSIIIVYTYIAIMITVWSASSHPCNAYKASRTVLLHLLQLCLCLTSTLFNMINPNRTWNINHALAMHIQYTRSNRIACAVGTQMNGMVGE